MLLRRMAGDTQSFRNSKDEGYGHSSGNKADTRKHLYMQNLAKSQALGAKRSAREASDSTTQTAPSPQSMWKAKGLKKGKGTPPSTSSTKQKSERLETHNMPSTVGLVKTSVEGKNVFSADFSGSKKFGKELSSLDPERKREKNLIPVTTESENAKSSPEVDTKRKKMNARSFMALFKRQRVPDGKGGLVLRDELSNVCHDNSGGIGSKPTGNGVVVTDECRRRAVGDSRDKRIDIDKASDEALQKYREKYCHEDIQNTVNVASSHGDNGLNEPCSNHPSTSSKVREMPDCPERLPTNCSVTENMDASESENSTCSGTIGDASVCSGIDKCCSHLKAAGDNPPPSSNCEHHDLLGTSLLCSMEKRVGNNSPEQDFCSCSSTVYMAQCNRKRIPYPERYSSKSETKRDGVAKKRKTMVNDSSDKASVQVDLGVDQVHQNAVSKEGSSRIKPGNQPENLHKDGNTSKNNPNGISHCNSFDAGVSEGMSEGRIVSSEGRKILPSSFQAEMMRLSQASKFSAEESTSKEEAAAAAAAAAGNLKKLNKKIKKRRKKLLLGHQLELLEFHEKWDKERKKFEMDHKLESAFVRTVHGQSLVGMDKLNLLNNDFNTKLQEINLQKYHELKTLKTRQSRDIDEEERRTARWVAEAESNLSCPASVGEGPQASRPSHESIRCEKTAEKPGTVSSQDEVRVSSLVAAEPVSQPKQMSDNDKSVVLLELPASAEQVPDELNASEKNSDEEGKVASPDALVDERCGPDQADGGDSQGPKLLVAQSEENAVRPDCGNLSSQQACAFPRANISVQQDTTNQISTPAELPAVENQNTLQIQTETIDLVTPSLSNHEEASVADESLTCVPTDYETVTRVLSDHETMARLPSNAGQSGEVLAVSENDMTTASQLVVSSTEWPNEAVFILGSETTQANAPSYIVYPSHHFTYGSSPPFSYIDPLQIEFENLRRETKQLEKHYKELVSRMQSDCLKEMQEIINQIRNKYNTKLQETENDYRSKKKELEKNQNKVLMNKLLATAFRSKFRKPKPAAIPGVQLGGIPSNFQHMQQPSTLPTTRPRPVTAPSLPSGPTQQIATPSSQSVHPLFHVHPIRSSSPLPVPSARPVIQVVHNTAALVSAPVAQPPLVAVSTTTMPSGVPRPTGEIRSAAPDLQPLRPLPGPRASSPPVPHPVHAPPPWGLQPQLIPVLANFPAPSRGGAQPCHPSLPPTGRVSALDLPDIGSNLGALWP